jgi:hypothetical protein
MYNLREKFRIILAIVKQCLQEVLDENGNVTKPGPTPKFSDAEIISLSLLSEALMIDSENYLFALLSRRRNDDFTHLIERSRYNRRRKQLNHLTEQVRQNLARQMASSETVFLVDSMPIEICKFVRAKRLRICQHDYETAPSFGGCVAKLKTYYGYKLHSVMTLGGVMTHFAITKANVADIHFLNQIKPYYAGCLLLGDRGYLSNPMQQELFEEYRILLNTPMRRNQNNYAKQPAVFRKTRKRIETAFSQLHDQFNIEKNYAKSFLGFITRILAKITALTISQFINVVKYGNPMYQMNQIKHALL